jgi:hypothetical protein
MWPGRMIRSMGGVCSKVIGLGAHGSLHAYNLHVEACQKKCIRSITRQPERAISLPVAVSMATVPNGIHQFTSLSPLIIGRHLHASLSPTPSPTSSPTSLFQPGLFDPGSGSDNDPPTPIQANSVPLPNNTNPVILINPPSDDLSPPTITLYSPQSHQMAPGMCCGIVVQWTPGTIWETYPFPSHSFVKHPWDIIEFLPPSHLRLRSKDCAGAVGPGGYGHACNSCSWIPQRDTFKIIEKRAHNAAPHTPHHLLTFFQLAAIPKNLRKMLDEARLKVLD